MKPWSEDDRRRVQRKVEALGLLLSHFLAFEVSQHALADDLVVILPIKMFSHESENLK
jgi:hypothetical protein